MTTRTSTTAPMIREIPPMQNLSFLVGSASSSDFPTAPMIAVTAIAATSDIVAVVTRDVNIHTPKNTSARNPPITIFCLLAETASRTFSGTVLETILETRDGFPHSPILRLDAFMTCLEARLIRRTMIIRIMPSSNRADCVREPATDSESCNAMVPVRVLIRENTFHSGSGMTGEFPVSMRTAMVSPMALPIPRMIAADIPERAAGMTTLTMESHLVAPMARDASR